MPDGKVTYVKKGETYFLPYGLTDLQNPTISVNIGDQVCWKLFLRIFNAFFILKGNI